MVNGLIRRRDVNMMMETKPKAKLSFENKWVDAFLGDLYVDDCDEPPAPLLKIEMVSFDQNEVCCFVSLLLLSLWIRSHNYMLPVASFCPLVTCFLHIQHSASSKH